MGKILHIETATDVCSVALAEDGEMIDLRETSVSQSHAHILTIFIQEIFHKNKLSITDLKAVAVSIGPGSYTGLRIGVSVAKGICYGARIPLIAIPTLDIMCYGINRKFMNEGVELSKRTIFAPMIDARRMEVYVSMYRPTGEIIKETSAVIVSSDTFDNFLANDKVYFFGSGADKLTKTIINDNAFFVQSFMLSSAFMISIAYNKYQNEDFVDTAYFEPLYLKNFILTTPKRKTLVQPGKSIT
jgi:tRNA threonylcarbamoyladenosine biosynthesis protein TsaB